MDSGGSEDAESGKEPEAEDAPTPRIPPDDPTEDETKHYAVARDAGSLTVVASGEGISTSSAPAEIVSGVVDHVAAVVRSFTAGSARLRSAQATSSMVFAFDDPQPDEQQATIPVEQTLSAAKQVSELIDLEGDELFARAVEMGPQTKAYAELASFVASRSLTLQWIPRGEEPKRLDHELAARQFRRLSEEPEMSEQKMTINGKLYKVITIEPGNLEGSVGIHLFNWSRVPPGFKKNSKVTVYYDDVALEAEIREGLIGQPVEVEMRLRQPMPGSTVIDPFRIRRELISIREGDGEDSDLGIPIDET